MLKHCCGYSYKLSVIYLLLAVFATSFPVTAIATSCATGYPILASQSEVDEFQVTFGPCDVLDFGIIISGSDITNLDGLSDLVSMYNTSIENNPALTSVDGLSNVSIIGHGLVINNNDLLQNVDGLSGLIEITDSGGDGSGLTINDNDALTNLNGLISLVSVASVQIQNNSLLTNCAALAPLVDSVDDGDPGPGIVPIPDVSDGVSGVILSDNLPGCNSTSEIFWLVKTIDFEGIAPEVDPWFISITPPYIEGDYSIATVSIACPLYDSSHPTENVNGSDVYFLNSPFNSTIARVDGGSFDMVSIDAALKNPAVPSPNFSVRAYFVEGGTLTQNFTLSSDWQTFEPVGFVNLTKVDITDNSISQSVQPYVLIDNVVFESPSDDFVTTWKTNNPGTSNSTSIMVPMVGGPYDVDWDNDGVFDEFGLTGPVTHDFLSAGTYTIRFRGTYDSIFFFDHGDREKIISLGQWGTNSWKSMGCAFCGATNLIVPAIDTPDFSLVTDMAYMFWGATLADPDTSAWETSSVTNMDGMFQLASSANPDVSAWDTSSVTNMWQMFWLATSFDQDVGSWDVTSLLNAGSMFNDVTLSTANYESLLLGWSVQTLQPGVTFSGGNSTYCSEAAIAARANMIASDSWVITDGGERCPPASPIVAPDLTPETDTGISDSDNITANNTPDFFVECSAGGNTVTLYTDYPSANTAVGTHLCLTDGTEITAVTSALPAGVHNVTYTITNVDGESGHSPSLAVTVELIFASGFE